MNYTVEQTHFDAARPFSVVATFRRFNRVIARYETREQAMRRAADMNRRSIHSRIISERRGAK